MKFSHFDSSGQIYMVDVSDKPIVDRKACAKGKVFMATATIEAIKEHTLPKGNPLEVARLAGILAAKQTDKLIPLCHSLPVSWVDVKLELDKNAVIITSIVRTQSRTGVEMEALTAVSVAALTVYDMCKAVDKGMSIGEICLESKVKG